MIIEIAVARNRADIIKLLLEIGLPLKINELEIMKLLSNGNLEDVKYILKSEVEYQTSYWTIQGYTLVDHSLPMYGDIELCDIWAERQPPLLPAIAGIRKAFLNKKLELAEHMIRISNVKPDMACVNMKGDTFREEISLIKKWNPSLVPNDSLLVIITSGTAQILEYILESFPTLTLTTYEADYACLVGKIEIVRLLLSLNPKISPSQKGLHSAIKDGHLELVRLLLDQQPPITPSNIFVDKAIENGWRDIVIELAKMNPPILPTGKGIDNAIKNGMHDVAMLMSTLVPPINPSENGLNYASKFKMNDILYYFATKTPPILPNIKRILGSDQTYLKDIFIHLHPNWVPDPSLIDFAILERTMEDVLWLYEKLPHYRPKQSVLDTALKKSKFEIIKWASQLTPPVLPSKYAIDRLIKTKTRYKIKKLFDLNLPPYPQ